MSMHACFPDPNGPTPRFRRYRRFWRGLLVVLCPAVLLAQTTTVFEMPLGRAGDTFTLKQLRTPPNTGFESTPLTLGINSLMGGPLLLFTTETLTRDYFITDETAGDSTSPNRVGTDSFNRRSFLTTPWFNEDTTPSTNFFISLPAARAGHQFSIGTSNTSSPLTLSPELAYSNLDEFGNETWASYGFFEGWASIGPASDSPFYFVIDQTVNEITDPLSPATRDLITVTWGPIESSSISGSGITRSMDIRVPDDNGNATFTACSGSGYVQNVQPVWERGELHLHVALGVNQDFWLQRMVDFAPSPTYHLGFFDGTLDLSEGIFPPNPAEDDDNSDPAGAPVNLIIPACRWDHPLMLLDVRDNYMGYVSVSHMNGYWSIDSSGRSWFTPYYQLDATATLTSPGPGWRVLDTWTGELSERNPRDLTAWISADADLDSDGDSLVDWYERLIGTDPFNVDTDGDGMSDGWEVAWGFNPRDPSDGPQDADGDGASNYVEFLNHTNPRMWDTDGDGMPDGWEIAHGLNPNVDDSAEDPDGDGLSNLQEYQLGTDPQRADRQGTDPQNADSDGDGQTDGWELAHGGNPTVAGNWLTVSISAGRLAHHFTLWRQGVASDFRTQLVWDGSSVWAQGFAEVYAGLAALTDDTTGEDFSLSGSGGNQDVEAVPWGWTPAASDGTYREYFLLPVSMWSDVLVICSVPDNSYPGTPPARISLVGGGSLVSNNVFSADDMRYNELWDAFEVSGTCLPGCSNWLVNLSTQQKAPLNVNYLLEGGWEANDIPLPLRSIDLQLRPEDNGRSFSLTSLGFNSQFATVIHTAGDAVPLTLHASIVAGLPLTVTRTDDNMEVSVPAPDAETTSLNLASVFPADPLAAVLPQDVDLITFRAGVEHTGIFGYNDSGNYPIAVWPDGTSGSVDSWDASGQIQTYQYVNYQAYVEPGTDYHFEDSAGNRTFWDASPWVPAPSAGSMGVALSWERRLHHLVVWDGDGTSHALQIQPGYEFQEYYYTAHQEAYVGLADHGWQSNSYGYVAAAVDFSGAGPFTVADNDTGESLQVSSGSGGTLLDRANG